MKSPASIFLMIILILAGCNSKEQRHQNPKTTDMTYPVKNISISINQSADKVYRFASDPINFPVWVEFVKSIRNESGNIWPADTDLGQIKIEFVPKNEFGILDHLVTLPDGSTVNNPMRVLENGKGCELIFTLFWMPGRTEEEFNEDAKLVESDLKKIKNLLEFE